MATTKKTAAKDAMIDKELLKAVTESRKQVFLTETDSPFADGYSIKLEEAFLKTLDPDDDDSMTQDRRIELEDRKDRLERMRSEYADKKGADAVVSRSEARGLDDLGHLIDDGADQMQLHTIEAYRMFLGRRREPGSEAYPIIGGKRIASSLRNLWMMTAGDNPFADWALVRHEHSMKELREMLKHEIESAQKLLDAPRERGIFYKVLLSSEPKMLTLGFRSPYGYEIAALIADFDYFVRLNKTLERKSLRKDEDVRNIIAKLTRLIRGVWNETARFDRWLSREEIKEMSRSDFVEQNPDESAAKRVAFATGVFGAVPSQIFKLELAPSHSRRRINLSDDDRRLIAEIGARLEKAEAEADVPDEAEDGAAANEAEDSATTTVQGS